MLSIGYHGEIVDMPTWEELLMIDPKNVTFGQYKITSCQEDILTLVCENLHGFIERKEVPPVDRGQDPCLELQCKDLNRKYTKRAVLKGLYDMRVKTFKFHFIHPATDEIIEVVGDFFPTIMDIKNTDRVILTVNLWALPFFLYYGVGQDGGRFSKKTALTLKGNYTKRLYKIISSQKERAEFVYPIERFREDLEIPKTYTNTHIKDKILKPIQESLRKSTSEVWFDFELICLNPTEGKKPKVDTVIFNIHTVLENVGEALFFDKYYCVLRWVINSNESLTRERAELIVKDIDKAGKLTEVYKLCMSYHDKVYSGDINMETAIQRFIYDMKVSFGINLK